MLKMRNEQLDRLKFVALERFENEMVDHASLFSPRLYEVIGEDQMRHAVKRALGRARTYGFTCRGPMRLYVELMLLYGCDFDSDPQYSVVGGMLRAPQDQMRKAEEIFVHAVYYQEKVAGSNAERVFKALEFLAQVARSADYRPRGSVDELCGALTRAFPEKAEYVGQDNLLALIQRAFHECYELQFDSPRARMLVAAMMYAFGHGFACDPLYPWISRTLKNERLETPDARAARLEKRALTWLDHVLAAPRGGGES